MKKYLLLLSILITLQGCTSAEPGYQTDNDDPGESVRVESPNQLPDDLDQ